MEETVTPAYFFEYALRPHQIRFSYRRHRAVLQIFAPAVRKTDEVLMVLVMSAFRNGIGLSYIEAVHYAFQQIGWHVFVVNDTERLTFLPIFQTFGYFLKDSVAAIVVYLHFGVTGKFECVSFKIFVFCAFENFRKRASHNVVYEHYIAFALFVRKPDETAAALHRKLEIGIFVVCLAVFVYV